MSIPQFKRYPVYKDSGVKWLGQIPAHWEVQQVKAIASVQLSNVDKKSVDGERAVRLCNYTDVYYHERINSDLDFMPATATPEQVRRFSLRKGDVLITKDSESWTDIAVSAVVCEDLPGVLCGYHLAHIRPRSQCHGPFLSRAFAAVGPRDQFSVVANGITRYGLGGEAIRAGFFAMPPMMEQCAIADFVDRETAKLDALIERKERLIQRLEEKRYSLLTRAVTEGLDASRSISNDGSIVFPRIPLGWEFLKIRRLLTRVRRPVRVRPETEYREVGIRSWGKGIFHKEPIKGALFGEKNLFAIEPGDFVLNIVFAWEGAVAVATERERGMVASHRFPTFRCSELVDLDYLLMVLQTDQGRTLMEVNSPGAAGRNKTIRLDQFLNEEIPLPSLTEQREAVWRFRRESSKLNSLAVELRRGIELLKERRTSLISAAVTGRIDVREDVA